MTKTEKPAAAGRQPEPPLDCARCPRLVAFRDENAAAHPDWFNAPVPSFGDERARLLIVGLAPGLQGANRTGRPFTGDYAGDLLYPTLMKFGFAKGTYRQSPDDGLRLDGAMITNAIRCVPPQNKPTGEEARHCRSFLIDRIHALPRLEIILALGKIAHDNTLTALGLRRAAATFGHAATHALPGGLTLIDSYHCSRYNTNTGRLTTDMFEQVFALIRERLEEARGNR